MKVYSMTSTNGNKVANQFEIQTDEGIYFQSYNSVIAFKPVSGTVQLDQKYWNYSRTTAKYRNIFLNESTRETQRKIDSGEYILTNLN